MSPEVARGVQEGIVSYQLLPLIPFPFVTLNALSVFRRKKYNQFYVAANISFGSVPSHLQPAKGEIAPGRKILYSSGSFGNL